MKNQNAPKKRVFFIAKRDKDIFEFLKDGTKMVETRAATVRNAYAQSGDTALFMCNKQRLEKRINKVSHFKSIDELLKKYPASKINPAAKNAKTLLAMYEHFPDYKEKIAQFGILAFELE